MRLRNWLVLTTGLLLAACGGGGSGSQVASIPTPPVSPSPPPPPPPAATPGTIIPNVAASQQFAGKGGVVEFEFMGSPSFDTTDSAQLAVRYDASTRQYQVKVPETSSWVPLLQQSGASGYQAGNLHVTFEQYAGTGYDFSALARWTEDWHIGALALGVPTPAGGVPVTGSASYGGQLAGYSTEIITDAWGPYPAFIGGDISLAFDFGAGTLSGIISPTHDVYEKHRLPTLSFTDTVYSTGSTTFSGRFATSLVGSNSFSGQFTGPNAQELIGSFSFPYVSPMDGKQYGALGGFVGKKP